MKPLFILLLIIFSINLSKQNSNIKPLNEQKAQTVALLECILGGDTFLKYFDNIMNSIEYKNTFKIIETVVSGFPENFKFMKKCYEDTKTEESVNFFKALYQAFNDLPPVLKETIENILQDTIKNLLYKACTELGKGEWKFCEIFDVEY
jgi:hypothetical protein